MTALFATGLTLKDFEEKLQAPCVLKHVTLSHDEFFKVAIDALAVVRKLTELTFQQCLMALQTSDPTISGYSQFFNGIVIILPDIEFATAKRMLGLQMDQTLILHTIMMAREAMQELLSYVKWLVPQRKEVEAYALSLFKSNGHDKLMRNIFQPKKPETWPTALKLYIQRASELDLKLPKSLNVKQHAVLATTLMEQTIKDCAQHCDSILASGTDGFAGSYADDTSRYQAQMLSKLLPYWLSQIVGSLELADSAMARYCQTGAATIFLALMDFWVCSNIRRIVPLELKHLSLSVIRWSGILQARLDNRRLTRDDFDFDFGEEKPQPSDADPYDTVVAEREAKAQAMADQLLADEELQQARELKKQAATKHQRGQRSQEPQPDTASLTDPSSPGSAVDVSFLDELAVPEESCGTSCHELPEASSASEDRSAQVLHPMSHEEAFLIDTMTCPLSKKLFQDPVILADGHTYERFAAEEWLHAQQVSPQTGVTLPHKRMIPNLAAKAAAVLTANHFSGNFFG